MQLITPTIGWALTTDRLARTQDGGSTWSDITPAGLAASALADVFFLSSQKGWLATPAARAETGSVIGIYRTLDGGTTWVPVGPVNASPAASGQTYLEFVDDLHGWAVVEWETSSNFSKGQLFFTADGGLTWTELSVPIAAPVEFSSLTVGLVAGGPQGDELYVTHDGGGTWNETRLPLPPAVDAAKVLLGTTYCLDAADPFGVCVQPASILQPPGETHIYVTVDGASTWEDVGSFPIPTDAAGVPLDVVDEQTWIFVTQNPPRLFETANRGKDWDIVSPNGLPGADEVDFASPAVGWATYGSGGCAGFKTDCTYTTKLFATVDGGQTWAELAP
jgi:photosystem II stability/assembly factor-like uncharacterized protein